MLNMIKKNIDFNKCPNVNNIFAFGYEVHVYKS